MQPNGPARYDLLDSDDTARVREQLTAEHTFFYHFTSANVLPSIGEHGLDPRFESNESEYAGRVREPAKAMRYCIGRTEALQAGYKTAETRYSVWSHENLTWLPSPDPIVVVRAPAAALLSRRFGLDHSHGVLHAEVEDALAGGRERLSAAEFVNLLYRNGNISCYDVIPGNELELSEDPKGLIRIGSARFSPLASPR
jgi:hypothetical protein